MSTPITRMDARTNESRELLQQLRYQLSADGQVVSERSKTLTLELFGRPLSPKEVVETICEEVRREGTRAVLRYSERIDKAKGDANSLRVSREQIRAAHQSADPLFLDSVRRIADQIEAFQRQIRHRDVCFEPSPGIRLEQRYHSLKRIGVCIPGGAAAYPSSVLMTVVPARVAGVREIAVIAPPTRYGAFNADVLAVCHELGVDEVYAVGGAQGVAALAYGIDQIASVEKIVGPGNQYVALAKKHVYGHVDIDSIAGPSEVIVIADETTPADFAAADLLAQAEHAPGASLLVTWHEDLMEKVSNELERQLGYLDRETLIRSSLEHFGALILVRDSQQAVELANWFAPEHLHLCCRHSETLVHQLTQCGAIFVGPYTPVAVGDYAAGPSHVLPTGGTARWASGLSVNTFLRSGSVIEWTHDQLSQQAQDICRIARLEGLTAHERSVTIRLKSQES